MTKVICDEVDRVWASPDHRVELAHGPTVHEYTVQVKRNRTPYLPRPDLGVGSELERHAVDDEEQALQACELRCAEFEEANVVVEDGAGEGRVLCECV